LGGSPTKSSGSAESCSRGACEDVKKQTKKGKKMGDSVESSLQTPDKKDNKKRGRILKEEDCVEGVLEKNMMRWGLLE